MEFINNFICFEEQQIELPDNFNGVVEVTSPFVRFISVGTNAVIAGLECIKDKSFMVFLVNDGINPITFTNDNNTVNPDQRIKVSTDINKTIVAGGFDVFVYTGNKWIVQDVPVAIQNLLNQ